MDEQNPATSLALLRARLAFAASASPSAALSALADARALSASAQRALLTDAARAAQHAAVSDASGLAALAAGDGAFAFAFFLEALARCEDVRGAVRARRLLNAGAALGRLARHAEARDFAVAAADAAGGDASAEAAALMPIALYNAAAASEHVCDLSAAAAFYASGAALALPNSELAAAFARASSDVEAAMTAAALEVAHFSAGALAADVTLFRATSPAIGAVEPRVSESAALPRATLGTAGLRGTQRPLYPTALEQNMRVLGIGQPRVVVQRVAPVLRERGPRAPLYQPPPSAVLPGDDDAVLCVDASARLAATGQKPLSTSPLTVSPRATIPMNEAGKALARECRPEFISLIPSPRPSPCDDAALRLSYVHTEHPLSARALSRPQTSFTPLPAVDPPLPIAAPTLFNDLSLSPLPSPLYSSGGSAPWAPPTLFAAASASSHKSADIIDRCRAEVSAAFAAAERAVLRPGAFSSSSPTASGGADATRAARLTSAS